MVNKALLVCWYRYAPRVDDHYKTQGEFFLKYAQSWLNQIDTIHLVDAGWGFESSHPNMKVINTDYRSHWDYMNMLFDQVEEDTFLLIDPDTIIYDPRVIEEGFKALESHGLCGILDNSGSLDLFPANQFRDTRRRYTPYMTFGHTKDFKGRDFTPTQKDGKFEFDSMGGITYELYDKLSLKEMRDDRFSVYLEESGEITTSINLDSPQFLWSADREDLGYYHVRNSSIGFSLLAELQVDKPAYKRRKEITPFREMMRLLMWQYQMDKHTGQLERWIDSFVPVLNDYGVAWGKWLEYSDVFESYYPWINQ